LPVEITFLRFPDVVTITSTSPDDAYRPLKVTVENPPEGFPPDDPVQLLKLVRRQVKEQISEDKSKAFWDQFDVALTKNEMRAAERQYATPKDTHPDRLTQGIGPRNCDRP
jgi:hypothetical protein